MLLLSINNINWGHVWMVTILGFLMVVVLLVVLIYILKLFGWIMQPKVKVSTKTPVQDAKLIKKNASSPDNDDEHDIVTLPANATAAIAMALHLYYNSVHDEEPTKVTIKKVDRRYSPWNSKLYGMNNLHRS